MEVYVVWTPLGGPLEAFTTERKSAALIELLSRDGTHAETATLSLNITTPDPVPEVNMNEPFLRSNRR